MPTTVGFTTNVLENLSKISLNEIDNDIESIKDVLTPTIKVIKKNIKFQTQL